MSSAAPTELREALATILCDCLRYDRHRGIIIGIGDAADVLIAGPLSDLTRQAAEAQRERDNLQDDVRRVLRQHAQSGYSAKLGMAPDEIRRDVVLSIGFCIESRHHIFDRPDTEERLDTALAEIARLQAENEGLRKLLAPIKTYADIALRPDADIGDGWIAEVYHGGVRHSLRTQDLRAIRDADIASENDHADA